MLEQTLREYFQEMAAPELPPGPVSLSAAARKGRARIRLRRASVIGAPIFAAGSVLTIAIASVAIGGPGAKPSAPGDRPTAPAHFSLTRPYGWIAGLPYRIAAHTTVSMNRTSEIMTYVPSQTSEAFFTVFSAGQCDLQGQKLLCAKPMNPGFGTYALGRRVGTVDGFPAYWQQGTKSWTGLSWRYADGGWALLEFTVHGDRSAGLAATLQLARKARFGPHAGPPVVYPVQLRSVPADWHLNTVSADLWRDRVLRAGAFILTPGVSDRTVAFSNQGALWFAMLTGASQQGTNKIVYICPSGPTRVVSGVKVVLGRYDYVAGAPHELCAPTADGLHFAYIVGLHPPIGVIALFARHLRLLGPNPEHWTTRLVG
jgi:hypothetical protein